MLLLPVWTALTPKLDSGLGLRLIFIFLIFYFYFFFARLRADRCTSWGVSLVAGRASRTWLIKRQAGRQTDRKTDIR